MKTIKAIWQWLCLLFSKPTINKEQLNVGYGKFVVRNDTPHTIYYKLEEQDRRQRIIDTLRAQLKRGSKIWRPRNLRRKP